METKSLGGPQRCRLILQQCLAIQLTKPGHTPEDFWMYDSGYMIFQNFLAANAQCWWNASLTAATRALKYVGHVAPGMLLVTAEPCALEILRGAYARSVLKPPATYVITSVGDIDDCIVTPIIQGQFTPLPEAICDVIMDVTAEGHSATIENIRTKLTVRFPHMTAPAVEVIYDSLVQLMQEQKIYQTAKGYFIFTPERRRSRSRPRSYHNTCQELEESPESLQVARGLLMSNAEALHSLYGEISTERDGDRTHQCIQTNLADVICGGNPNDKIIFPRASKRRSASFPTPHSLERRHSLRIFGSSKRLQRCSSTKSLSKTYAQALNTDSSSSEYQSTDSSSPKKGSLLSRLFRRSGRTKTPQIETYSAQFPPAEWFNSRAVHLHSIGTQTTDPDQPVVYKFSNSTFYDGSELSQRSMTLPRRHRRHMSSESTFLMSSRDCSPIRRRSPLYCNNSLPRSTQSIPATSIGFTAGAGTDNTKSNNTSATSRRLSTALNTATQKLGGEKQLLELTPSGTSSLISRCKRQISSSAVNGFMENKNNYRPAQSGPSSLESGKTSTITSGPSSIDSENAFLNRMSGHSSLDSQCSNTAVVQSNKSRSIIVLNSSPRGTPRHQALRARAAENSQRNFISTSPRMHEQAPLSHNTSNGNTESKSGTSSAKSSNSITLQVTTSNSNQNNIPSTKIFVNNSPIHSVITLENGNISDNSNVLIINNEMTTNDRGDIVRKTLSKQQTALTKTDNKYNHHHQQQQQEEHENEELQKGSYSSKNVPNSGTVSRCSPSAISTCSLDKLNTIDETSKFAKNVNNDITMNNSRKHCLSITQNNAGHIVYKNNVLKDDSQLIAQKDEVKDEKSLEVVTLANENFEISNSIGDLHSFEKNSKENTAKTTNFTCELNNMRYGSATLLPKSGNTNSSQSINSSDLAHILQKNITLDSEPNLVLKDHNCLASADKSVEKQTLNRQLSLSKENTDAEEIFNFPSLTDLSFNFTSLAAQKILQGVSLSSIDTLAELNVAAAAAVNNTSLEKQQNNKPSPMCTDYGLV